MKILQKMYSFSLYPVYVTFIVIIKVKFVNAVYNFFC